MTLRVSVVLSTYEQPAWLELALRGYARQTRRPSELLVADDGSGGATRAAIERVVAETGLPVRHVWHPDRGFRKCTILNRAIAAADGDYLILSDGDCVPREDFVDAHVRLARPGRYLAGGGVRVPRRICETLTVDDVVSGRLFDLRWLRRRGYRPGHKRWQLMRTGRLAAALDALTPSKARLNGLNASVWRDALLAANGFEGRMGYGQLDRELGDRLDNLGLRARQVRHRAVVLHLWHERPYREPGAKQRNWRFREEVRRTGRTRALDGIAELAAEPSSFVERLGPEHAGIDPDREEG